MQPQDTVKGLYLHLQRLSTEDGPGIRTTIFFKGCPLRCTWCHNPESISAYPELQWYGNRCIGCRSCQDTCESHALNLTPEGNQIDRKVCTGCGLCAQACPTNALEILGTEISTGDLFSELIKDSAFYAKSGGGVTASGGEPTLQAEFVGELFERLQDAGIHTALDTCGLCRQTALEELLPHTNLVLFDLKEIDSDRHKRFTGSSNQRILENLAFLVKTIEQKYPQIDLWIRTPIIPGATASEENLHGIGAYIAEHTNQTVKRWDLCAFNNLCRDKYQRLGLEWKFTETPLLSREKLDTLEAAARSSGVDPSIVVTSGLTRIETE